MSDDRAPKKSWPNDYYVGPADHLHAFGVLLTAFNSFEDGIFSIYRHHLDLLKVPFPFVETVYFSLPDDKRIEAMQTIFAECEKDPNVISLVSNLIQYFKWCLDVRNKLAHAEFYPISFLGKKPGRILIEVTCKLNCQRSATWPTKLLMVPSTALPWWSI